MESRRSFIKKASLLAGSAAFGGAIPSSIARAMAISPDPGTTYLNAEHIVFLMQENRSFDHCFGSLKGVRGFNDPRAIDLSTGMPVWFQRNTEGKTALPFHLDIKNTKSTWMGSLPHGWDDMVAARNHGKMDKWLEAKKPGNPEYQEMPLTMGYYDRQDLPFYYAFADAFTVCDQHFCSTLTGTSPNRNYFWAGTVREDAHNPNSKAHTENGMIDFKNVSWKTYPERLEEAGVSWGVYQNELSIPTELEGTAEYWLANFTDNDLEFIKQYNVRFHPEHRAWMQQQLQKLQTKAKETDLTEKELKQKALLEQDLETYSEANFEKLSEFEKAIHKKAFITNRNAKDYHELATLKVEGKEVSVPKGDVLHQFREDVNNGTLPTVSWLVAPCAFSDHPGSPWYGAWYVSETLDILTKNPEMWKKTIFIVTYDENDGYFDHVPPFVAPKLGVNATGATTNISTEEEFVEGKDNLGLGFRVPMIIASPWSKGGFVNSEVFDHTSSLQFLEHFLEQKTGKKILEENIGEWRRAVCGNLTSVFRAADTAPPSQHIFVNRDAYIEQIYLAKDKQLPSEYEMLNDVQVQQLKENGDFKKSVREQERGTKPACAIPYNPELNCRVTDGKAMMTMKAAAGLSATKKIAVPFQVYHMQEVLADALQPCLNFTVTEGEVLQYPIEIPLEGYHLKAYAPNGFFREFKANNNHSNLDIKVTHQKQQSLQIEVLNNSSEKLHVQIQDISYQLPETSFKLKNDAKTIVFNLNKSYGWYDFEITIKEYPGFLQRFAGHVENGKMSSTDPLMGGIFQTT